MFFPEVAAQLLHDLENAGARDADIRPVLDIATHERLLDVASAEGLRAALRRHPRPDPRRSIRTSPWPNASCRPVAASHRDVGSPTLRGRLTGRTSRISTACFRGNIGEFHCRRGWHGRCPGGGMPVVQPTPPRVES